MPSEEGRAIEDGGPCEVQARVRSRRMSRALRLDFMGNEGDPVLMSALDARAARVTGSRVLPPMETLWLFEDAWYCGLNMVHVRDFAQETQLAHDLPRLRDEELRDLVLRQIERGDLVAVSSDSVKVAPEDPVLSERRRLVDDIEAVLGKRELRVGGWTCLLVLGADLAGLADRKRFVALPSAEAARLLSAKQAGMLADVYPLLERARALLATSERTPEASRFVLLRRVQVVAVPAPLGETPATPSQLLATVEKTWIEIGAAFDDGTPYTGTIEVRLADGRVVSGTAGADGVFRLDGILPGSCKVRFPDLDAAAWGPA
jgi:hypothetical protein